MMVGGLFASLGMILASFANNIIQIYLSTGVITGELFIIYINFEIGKPNYWNILTHGGCNKRIDRIRQDYSF